MSWQFLLIIIPLLRSTKINVYGAIFQTHSGFSYSISVSYVYSLSVLNGLLELLRPLPVSPVAVCETARHCRTQPGHTHTHPQPG